MLFPKKMRFSLDGKQIDGYISEKGMEFKEMPLCLTKSYITKEKLCLPPSIFTKNENTEIVIPDRAKTDYSGFEYIYKYAMLSNYTAIPLFTCLSKSRLAGFAFPPINDDSCKIHFVSTKNDIVVDGYKNYIKIFRNKLFKDIPQVLTNWKARLDEEFISGVLFVDKKPVCAIYLNEKDFVSAWVEFIANTLVTGYVCSYAQSLLNKDEVLMVDEDCFAHVIQLFGISADGNIRGMGYGSPLLRSKDVVRQPFIHFANQPFEYSSSYYVSTNIPDRHIECSAFSVMNAQRKTVTAKKKEDIVSLIFDIAESIEEMKYDKEEAPYAQVFGYNGLMEFPHKFFSEKSLRWMGDEGYNIFR